MTDDRKPPRRNAPRRDSDAAGGSKSSGKPARYGKPAAGGDKPFRKKPEGGAPKRSYAKPAHAGEGPRAAAAETPQKPFRPRGGERPAFRPKPVDGEGGQGRFRARPAASAPANDAPREPYRSRRTADEGREHKPFRPREGAESKADFKPAERKPFPRGAAPVEDGERIAKRLARVGIASRRDAEELIAAGRVKVNGRKLDSPAFNVTLDDVIELDGALLPPVERTRLFLFHKPAGVVTTSRDPEGRKTVYDVLPTELPRLITVGRLDINTEGLMLLTNDGGLARTLELPATGWLRRYRVRVHGKVEEKQLADLREGIAVDGVFYGAIEATLDREQGSNAWLTLGFREGKNREVKNILGSLGLDVTRLIRISFGPFQLGELAEGHVQEIKGKLLRDQLGERLIEESGANFEADILKPFSNEPQRRGRDAPAPVETAPFRPLRDEPPIRIGEGGLVKKRFKRASPRDEALDKLSTEKPRPERGERPVRTARPERGERPDRGDAKPFVGGKPFGAGKPRGKTEREQRPIEAPRGRKANVWMAPGARPIGAGRAAAEKADTEARRASKRAAYGKPAGARPVYGKPAFGKPRGERPEGARPDGGKPPRKGGPGADRRR